MAVDDQDASCARATRTQADQMALIAGGARRMRAVRGILVVRCGREDGKDRAAI